MLKQIVAHKWEELREQKRKKPVQMLLQEIQKQPQPRDLKRALQAQGSQVGVIAEIKKAAPTRSTNCPELGVSRPVSCKVASVAREYERAGAAAVSVLTDHKYFAGSLEDLVETKNNINIPVLRKDFLIDEYHIYEARANGADAVLLISSLLAAIELERMIALAGELGMTALVEAGREAEIEKAVQAGAEIIGINNRNLQTLEVDLERTARWGPFVPRNRLLVSESGITGWDQVVKLKEKAGIDAVLVGRTLMKSASPAEKIMELRGKNVPCAC